MGRDIGDVLNDTGMGVHQFVQLLLVGGIMMSDGAEILLCSTLLGALKDAWHLSAMVRGTMMSIVFVGVFVGGLIGGQLGDMYGRRRPVMVSYVGIVISGLAAAAAQGPISMLICRFFFGAAFGCGMGPSVVLMVESAPAVWRAHIVNLANLWFTAGEIWTAVLLVIFMPQLTDPTGTHWRWVSVLSMGPGLLLLPFTYLLLKESPRFLLSRGRRCEAIAALQYIGHMNNVSEKVDRLDSDDADEQLELVATPSSEETEHPSSSSSSRAALVNQRQSVGRRPSTASLTSQSPEQREQEKASIIEEERLNAKSTTVMQSFAVLFSAEYRSIVLGGAYVCFLSNSLFYGLTYALPQIFTGLSKDITPAFQVLIVSVCDFPGVLLSFLLIYSKSIGHRSGLMVLASAASLLCLSLISIDYGPDGLYVGLASAYLVKYVSSSFFTLSYVYLSEVFPSEVRSAGLSLCIACGRIGSMTAPLIVESLRMTHFNDKLTRNAPFLIFSSVLCMIGVVVIKFALYFELKNAPLNDGSAAAAVKKQKGESLNESRSPRESIPIQPAPAG